MRREDTPKAQGNLKQIFYNGVLYNNPVLIGALGMCPVIAAGFTLKNGVALSIILAILIIPTCVISSLLFSRMEHWLRVPLIVLISSLFYVGACFLIRVIFSNMPAQLGLYAPILVVNSILVARADWFAPRHVLSAAFVNAASCALGFAFVICLASAIREIFAFGTIWGRALVGSYQQIPAVAMPFFGFLVLGYLGAAFQGAKKRREKRLGKDEKTDVAAHKGDE